MELLIFLQTSTTDVATSDTGLFTQESLLTLVGLTGMVYVSSNTIQSVFNYNPKWLALVLSLILSFIAVTQLHDKPKTLNYIIAFFNGCLVYLSAAGATGVGDASAGGGQQDELVSKSNKRKFSEKWW